MEGSQEFLNRLVEEIDLFLSNQATNLPQDEIDRLIGLKNHILNKKTTDDLTPQQWKEFGVQIAIEVLKIILGSQFGS